MKEDAICSRTGLSLVRAAGQTGFRVAQDRHGALAVMANKYVGPLPDQAPGTAMVERRGRYDTMGRTVYIADSKRCSYAEVLTVFRMKLASVAETAESVGWDVDEYISQVLEDAKANGVDPPWAIPAGWQINRSIHTLSLPSEGWWVLIDHQATLAALQRMTPTVRGTSMGLRLLTAGSIMGENRALTTILAQTIRDQTLEDGSEPLGISYESKTLHGRCWAFWDRRLDLDLPPGTNDPHVASSSSIGEDPDFHHIASHYRLPY